MVNVPLLLEPVERAVKVSGAPAEPLGHVLNRDLPEILRQRLHEIELNYSISNRLFMNGTDRVPTHHRVDVVIGAQDQRRLLLFRAILVFPVHPEARSPHQTFSRLHPVVVHHRLFPPAQELVLAIVKDEALVEVIHTTVHLHRLSDGLREWGRLAGREGIDS